MLQIERVKNDTDLSCSVRRRFAVLARRGFPAARPVDRAWSGLTLLTGRGSPFRREDIRGDQRRSVRGLLGSRRRVSVRLRGLLAELPECAKFVHLQELLRFLRGRKEVDELALLVRRQKRNKEAVRKAEKLERGRELVVQRLFAFDRRSDLVSDPHRRVGRDARRNDCEQFELTLRDEMPRKDANRRRFVYRGNIARVDVAIPVATSVTTQIIFCS